MKITLKIISLFLTFLAIWIGLFVNSDKGRVWYNRNFEHDLCIGISRLFVSPNKYKDANEIPHQDSNERVSYNYIYEEADKDAFKAVEKFILDHYEGNKDLSYDLQFIASTRRSSLRPDPSNPDYYHAEIWFVKESEKNKNLVLPELEADIFNELVLKGEIVAHQRALTEKLDDYFGNKIMELSVLVFCLGFILSMISILDEEYSKNNLK